jgi:pimeloyl-ACP methyl ester carboxylesterase
MNDDTQLAASLDQIVGTLPLQRDEKAAPARPTAAERRMARMPPGLASSTASVTLERADGVLRWAYRRPPRALGPRRANRRGPDSAGAEKVHEFRFQEIPPNQIIEKLEQLDSRLNPTRGLRRWLPPPGGAGQWQAAPFDPAQPGELLIHGTFSKGDMFFSELGHTAEGRAALLSFASAGRQLLTFDHPTLSISPLLNALDLQRELAGYRQPLDLICHSRGGLVAAWWLRLTSCTVKRVVFVGSPLEGTSLAAPARIKVTLDYLANFADVLARTTAIAGAFLPPIQPVLSVAAGLMAIVGGALQVGAQSSLTDAGVALVPGLQAQSRVANNQELLRLHHKDWKLGFRPYAITANFEPETPDAPLWKFWRRWNNPVTRIASRLTVPLFDRANDLVVDCDTMERLSLNRFADVHNFKAEQRVHHCNYFAQAKTAELLTDWLAPA